MQIKTKTIIHKLIMLQLKPQGMKCTELFEHMAKIRNRQE